MCLCINETKKLWSRFCYERLCYHTKIIYCSYLFLYIWKAYGLKLEKLLGRQFFQAQFFQVLKLRVGESMKNLLRFAPSPRFHLISQLSIFPLFLCMSKVLLINSFYSCPPKLDNIIGVLCYSVLTRGPIYVQVFLFIYLDSRVEITFNFALWHFTLRKL